MSNINCLVFCEHTGNCNWGHYKAHCCFNGENNDDDEQWYWFDDPKFQEEQPENARVSNAYLLFYKMM